ncbi:MAG: 1-acyl-sn-glycerol-3-phosphate acyltransferase [Gemmatimonadota bacterium]|nr:1-acyl-sn-glycerol-3-phosphate acyltransferase [Gemmatimonadota bacterium]
MQRLVNAWVWTTTVLVLIFGFFYVVGVWLLTAPFDPGRYAAGRAFRHLAVAATWLNPYWRFRTSGVAIRDPRRPYVVVANHESYADIFLVSHLQWEMKWLAKDTIFRIPVMGWMMRMAGDIPIIRGNPGSGMQALEACRDRLSKKVSVMIFPEGTRTRSDELLPFKDGAFQLAVSTGSPIIPIAIAGTRDAMAKGSFRFRRANAICRVLEPIETVGLASSDVSTLRDATRELIAEARRQLQRELERELELARGV